MKSKIITAIILITILASCVSTNTTEPKTSVNYIDVLWMKTVERTDMPTPTSRTNVYIDANQSISTVYDIFHDYLFFASSGKLFHKRFPDSIALDSVIISLESQIKCSSENTIWREINTDIIEWMLNDSTGIRRYGQVSVEGDTLTWDLWNYQDDTTKTVKSYASGEYGLVKAVISVPKETCNK